MKLASSFAIVVFSFCSAACMTEQLNSAGAQVATSQSAPVDHGYSPGACKNLGYIVGRGGGSFGGGWISNEQLVEYAMNDLRNKAAGLGANYIQHDTPQLGVAGSNGSTTTSTATVSGTAYACTGTPAAGAPAATPPTLAAAAAASQPPEGAGGFRFGVTQTDAERACTQKGFTWKKEADGSICSGALVAIGAPAMVRVRFCGDNVCAMHVLATPDAAQLAAKYDELYKSLRSRYGAPLEDREPTSTECARDLKSCLASGKAPRGAAWKWPSGFRIEAKLASPASGPAVELIYMNPAGVQQFVPGPAL
jgi:hypothetical protein